MLREKMLHEGEDVLFPVSERREAEANSVDSKIQFRSKSPEFDFFLQIAQCRRDDAKAPGILLLRLSVREEVAVHFLERCSFMSREQVNDAPVNVLPGSTLPHQQHRYVRPGDFLDDRIQLLDRGRMAGNKTSVPRLGPAVGA